MESICVGDNPILCVLMLPMTRAKRTFSGDICFRAARLGARGTPPSWQPAQRCLKSASPSLLALVSCGCVGVWAKSEGLNTEDAEERAQRPIEKIKRGTARSIGKLRERFISPFPRCGYVSAISQSESRQARAESTQALLRTWDPHSPNREGAQEMRRAPAHTAKQQSA